MEKSMLLDRFSTSQPWSDFLPATCQWVGDVSIEQSQGFESDAHTIVAATVEASGTFTLLGGLEKAWSDKLTAALTKLGWKGRGSLALTVDDRNLVVVPMSKLEVSAAQLGRQFGMDAANFLKNLTHSSLSIVTPKNLKAADIFEGLATAYYSCTAYKKGSANADQAGPKLPRKLRFSGATLDSAEIANARALTWAASLCRMLQDAPPNWLDPERFAEVAKGISAQLGVKCTVLDEVELGKMGMGSLLAVAQGSVRAPRVITVEIPGVDTSKTVALVGKGLTFDAGGISLKPSEGMGEMKYDMSGGAAVLATAGYLAKVKPQVNVVCIVGAVENMPSGAAVKPGDTVVSMSGKTIEILNTDAEGRLVLADLLHYANTQFRPEWMINIATLTGAVLHALGTAGAALMSNDDGFADYLLKSSAEVGEPLWRLPLWPELGDEVKSEIADLQNIAKPSVKAGSIMGGMFLKEFVGKTKWAHLDIAGTGWSCKATGYPATGGSAFGLRTMIRACTKAASL
jgi:leucyl aminopeptidase